MHKLAKTDKENVKIVVSGCPCANKLSRKSDRPALANIQNDPKKSVPLQTCCVQKPSSQSKLRPPAQNTDTHKFRSKSSSSATKTSVCCKITAKVQLSSEIPIRRTASTVRKTLFESSSQKSTSSSSGYVSGCSDATPHFPVEAATLPSQRFVTLSHESCYSVAASIATTKDPKQFEVQQHSAAVEPKSQQLSRKTLDVCSTILEGRNVNLRRATLFSDNQEVEFENAAAFLELNKERPETQSKTSRAPPISEFGRNLNPTTKDANSGRIPAVKSTLMRQHSQKKQSKFPLLYTPEYIENIIDYSYGIRDKLRLRRDWIQTKIDTKARTHTLNWLMTVYPFKNYPESIYYTAVRLFDYAILGLGLEKKAYTLAAIVSLWLAEKYHGPGILVASKIALLFKGDYCKKGVLSMERNILKSIDFCFKMADPLDFLYYYLIRAKRENDELLKCAAKFVLECSTLFGSYSTLEPSFTAAASLYMAYQVVYSTPLVPFDFRWYGLGDIERFVQNHLKLNVNYAIYQKFEPFFKYSNSKKMGVAVMFFDTQTTC